MFTFFIVNYGKIKKKPLFCKEKRKNERDKTQKQKCWETLETVYSGGAV